MVQHDGGRGHLRLLPRLRGRDSGSIRSVIHGISRMVNADPALRMAMDETGAIGVYDRVDPTYTIFHKDDETFSVLWTAYQPDLRAFCQDWEADRARYGTSTPLKPARRRRDRDSSTSPPCLGLLPKFAPGAAGGQRLPAAHLYPGPLPEGERPHPAAPGHAGPPRRHGRLSRGAVLQPPQAWADSAPEMGA